MRQLLLLGFCSLFLGLSAQSGIILRVDYERSQLTGSDLNDFFDSYNDYYGRNLPKEFDDIPAGAFSHPNYGAGIRILGLSDDKKKKLDFSSALFMTYGQGRFSQDAAFQNGIITQTDLLTRDYTLQFEVGVLLFQRVSLTGHMSGRFRTTVMDLGYIYQDGTYSLGNEYDVLGVYKASTNTLDFGGSVGLRLGRFYLSGTLSLPSDAFSDDGLLTLVDFDKRQIRWTDLPRDFETWADDPANLDLDDGFVRAQSLRAVRISIGLAYILGRNRR